MKSEISVRFTFKFDELSDEAKEKAREWWREVNAEECFWANETVESMKEAIKAAGLKLTDWSIDYTGGYSYIRLAEFSGEDLTGKRAYAWLENNLLGQFRVGLKDLDRRKQSSYGNKAGEVKSCPFTGYCFDEDIIEDLKSSIKSGMTIKESFLALADLTAKCIRNEIEEQNKDENIDELLEVNEYEFLESGELA